MLDNFRANFRAYGFKSILRSLDWRTPSWLFHYSHALLTRGPLTIGGKAPSDDYSFRLATDADTPQFQEIGVSEAVADRRLAAGDVCGIALTREGKLVAMLWSATGNILIEEVGHPLNLDPDGIYSYNAYTAESERRKGLFTGCARVLYDFHRSQGRRFVYGAVSIFNLPSQAAGETIGREIAGETVLIRLLGVEWHLTRKWPTKVRRLRIGFRKSSSNLRRV